MSDIDALYYDLVNELPDDVKKKYLENIKTESITFLDLVKLLKDCTKYGN